MCTCLLTLGRMGSEGYGSRSVCLCVCLQLSVSVADPGLKKGGFRHTSKHGIVVILCTICAHCKQQLHMHTQ